MPFIMPAWVTFGFLLALIGSQVIAKDVHPDFAENVNTRMAASRIVSGWEAELGMWPHQVSLRMVNGSGSVTACGGSIIHEEWVMTAAHCTAGRVNIIIRAGLVNLTEPEYIYESDEWYNHPLYNDALPSVVQPHDISLLKLKSKVTFSPHLQPIRLQSSADQDKNYHDIQLIASGYGLTWTQGSSPEVLNWVYLRGVTNFDCWVTYGFSPIIADSTICARYYNVTSQSTCQGDSGGPLSVVEQDGRLTIVGVTSFVSGEGCHTEHPAGFIRPGHYHSWFLEVTGINFDWDWEDSEEDTSTVTAPPESEEEVITATPPPAESSEEEVVTATPPPTESSEEEEVTATPPPSESSEEEEVTVTPPPAESSEEEEVTVTPPPAESSEEEEVTVTPPAAESSEEEAVTATPTLAESSEEEEVAATTPPPAESSEEEVTVTAPPAESSEEEGTVTVPPAESSEEDATATAPPAESSEEEEVSVSATSAESSEEDTSVTESSAESSEEEVNTTASSSASSEEEVTFTAPSGRIIERRSVYYN